MICLFTKKSLERLEVWNYNCSIEPVICHVINHTNTYVIDTEI